MRAVATSKATFMGRFSISEHHLYIKNTNGSDSRDNPPPEKISHCGGCNGIYPLIMWRTSTNGTQSTQMKFLTSEICMIIKNHTDILYIYM